MWVATYYRTYGSFNDVQLMVANQCITIFSIKCTVRDYDFGLGIRVMVRYLGQQSGDLFRPSHLNFGVRSLLCSFLVLFVLISCFCFVGCGLCFDGLMCLFASAA